MHDFFYFFYNAIFLRLIQLQVVMARGIPHSSFSEVFFHSLIPRGIDLSLLGSLRSSSNNLRTSKIEKSALFEEFRTLPSLLLGLFSLFLWGQSKYVRKFEISQRIFENCIKWKEKILTFLVISMQI